MIIILCRVIRDVNLQTKSAFESFPRYLNRNLNIAMRYVHTLFMKREFDLLESVCIVLFQVTVAIL